MASTWQVARGVYVASTWRLRGVYVADRCARPAADEHAQRDRGDAVPAEDPRERATWKFGRIERGGGERVAIPRGEGVRVGLELAEMGRVVSQALGRAAQGAASVHAKRAAIRFGSCNT